MNTYNDIFLKVRRRLRAAEVSAYDLEARLIVCYAAGKSREELINLSRYYVTDNSVLDLVEDMLERRLKGEPVAYIVGEWEFYGLPLAVNRNVLIPRVDTEVLADEVIKLVKKSHGKSRLLDLCAGCGAIGIAVAANVPDCKVVLADNSDKALAVCRENMLRTRVSRNSTAIKIDAMKAPPALLGVFDVIVSNPPYIPTKDLVDLDISVRDYEPIIALDGGTDGLDFFRAISEMWSVMLKKGGYLAFECGEGQANDVREIMADADFGDIVTRLDTLGIERVVVGTRK